jgi:hypothetical protein
MALRFGLLISCPGFALFVFIATIAIQMERHDGSFSRCIPLFQSDADARQSALNTSGHVSQPTTHRSLVLTPNERLVHIKKELNID